MCGFVNGFTMQPDSVTSCDIYRREIAELRESGDVDSLSEMIETWYTRCGFDKVFEGMELQSVYVRPDGRLLLSTSRGELQFCRSRGGWRLVEFDRDPLYAMFRIAEVTQVPFAYLCGLRDAAIVVESSQRCELSEQIANSRRELSELNAEIRRRRIAIDSVCPKVSRHLAASGVSCERYPEAPAATLTWNDVRKHFRKSPGVYFAWSSGKIVYVGATETGMGQRLSSGHHAVTRDDRFSFVEIAANEVFFAESCYVARYAPARNACVAQANGLRKGGKRGKAKQKAG